MGVLSSLAHAALSPGPSTLCLGSSFDPRAGTLGAEPLSPHPGSSDFTKTLPGRGTGSPTQPLLFEQTRLHLEDEQNLS